MSWDADIANWADRNSRNPEKVEKICIRKGWDPNSYTPSMQKNLFEWLDAWYTLSVKTLPSPATSRKNPIYYRNPDEDIRYLERRYELTGDPEDGKHWAQALDRAGMIQRLPLQYNISIHRKRIDIDFNSFQEQLLKWRRFKYLETGQGEPDDEIYYEIDLHQFEDRASMEVSRRWEQAVGLAVIRGMPRFTRLAPDRVAASPIFPYQAFGGPGFTKTTMRGAPSIFTFLIGLEIVIEELGLIIPNFTPIPDSEHDTLYDDTQRVRQAAIELSQKMYRQLGFDPPIVKRRRFNS